jgi:glutamyl-tRNA reductase
MALGEKVLLVGAGSIGRYHLKYLSVIFKEIYILDTDLEIAEKINSDLKIRIVKIFHSFSEIDDLEIFELAVISNLGPDHYVTFINLVEKGVKNFLLEIDTSKAFIHALSQIEQIPIFCEFDIFEK